MENEPYVHIERFKDEKKTCEYTHCLAELDEEYFKEILQNAWDDKKPSKIDVQYGNESTRYTLMKRVPNTTVKIYYQHFDKSEFIKESDWIECSSNTEYFKHLINKPDGTLYVMLPEFGKVYCNVYKKETVLDGTYHYEEV